MAEPEQDAAAAPGPDPGTRGPEATVLVVEDRPMVRNYVVNALQMNNYQVLAAANAAEAWAQCQGCRAALDLLIMDVVLPQGTGFELAQRIREARPGIRVLFISGYYDASAVRDVDARAAFLRKPFRMNALLSKVRSVLASPATAIPEPKATP